MERGRRVRRACRSDIVGQDARHLRETRPSGRAAGRQRVEIRSSKPTRSSRCQAPSKSSRRTRSTHLRRCLAPTWRSECEGGLSLLAVPSTCPRTLPLFLGHRHPASPLAAPWPPRPAGRQRDSLLSRPFDSAMRAPLRVLFRLGRRGRPAVTKNWGPEGPQSEQTEVWK